MIMIQYNLIVKYNTQLICTYCTVKLYFLHLWNILVTRLKMWLKWHSILKMWCFKATAKSFSTTDDDAIRGQFLKQQGGWGSRRGVLWNKWCTDKRACCSVCVCVCVWAHMAMQHDWMQTIPHHGNTALALSEPYIDGWIDWRPRSGKVNQTITNN